MTDPNSFNQVCNATHYSTIISYLEGDTLAFSIPVAPLPVPVPVPVPVLYPNRDVREFLTTSTDQLD